MANVANIAITGPYLFADGSLKDIGTGGGLTLRTLQSIYDAAPGIGGGALTRPTVGQVWPRGMPPFVEEP
jgi:hypothetical protein